MMGEPIACVVTNGGPLIALPREIVGAWRGVLPPAGALVAAGWEWGDGGVVCDYDRACDPPDAGFGVDDSWAAWPVSVGDRMALVLDGECGTTALRTEDGVVIVRDVGIAGEAELVALITGVAPAEWIDFRFDLDLRGGGLVVFDAAYGGDERESADGGVIEITVTPGIYRLRIAYPPEARRTTLVRLIGARQDATGRSGVVVR